MWKMFDDMIECNECGGPLGPPPKFMIPPPPRPPSMVDYSAAAVACNEEEMALKAQQSWDSDMCEAMPILDASLYSSQSLQTSAMIAVFSLLLVLVVLISSLFVWKNKRKVQNFLPCKTPTRGPHINGGLPLGAAHAVTYEDPDVHLGHRPLVMRHHHNVELMHSKGIHYPSGYPMTRSPPFLVSSSPGPDPYRSNDNVYEELGPGRDSDADSEPPMHSDDDFAEDELSLPGERSFNKALETPGALPATAGIYHERAPVATVASITAAPATGNVPERNSLLSSSSSTHDASTATAASSSSSHNNNSNNATTTTAAAAAGSSTATRSAAGGLLAGMLRHTTGRNGARKTTAAKSPSIDEFNSSTSTAATADAGDLTPIQQLYDARSNLMSLAYAPQHAAPPTHFHSLHHIHHHNNNNAALRTLPQNVYNTLENDVERRNRINAQLSHPASVMQQPSAAPLATIFRERIHYPGSARYPQPFYASNSGNGPLSSSMRARTNPRSMDRRHRVAVAAPLEQLEPAYGYAEPMYQQNYHYDSCDAPTQAAPQRQALVYPAYIMPHYGGSSGGSYRSVQHPCSSHGSQTYQNASQLYARGDSSFGSDSGYSHHTPASSIGRQDYDVALPMPATATTSSQRPVNKLASALSFGWNRRKSTSNTAPSTLAVQHTTAPTSCAILDGATSPNNNSGASSSTGTTSLEHSVAASNNNGGSSSSGATPPQQA